MPRRTTLAPGWPGWGSPTPPRPSGWRAGTSRSTPAPATAGCSTALAAAADPDLALAALARMPRDTELLTALHQDADLARRLALVLGASAALGDHLARHPEGLAAPARPGAARLPARRGAAAPRC